MYFPGINHSDLYARIVKIIIKRSVNVVDNKVFSRMNTLCEMWNTRTRQKRKYDI